VVSAVNSGSSGPGSGSDRGHSIVFLGTSLYSHNASLYSDVNSEFIAGGNLAMVQHPIWGGVEILPVA